MIGRIWARARYLATESVIERTPYTWNIIDFYQNDLNTLDNEIRQTYSCEARKSDDKRHIQ